MADDHSRETPGSMAYPKRGSLDWIIYKTPPLLFRMGLGSYFLHPDRGGSRMLAMTTLGRKTRQPRYTMLTCVTAAGRDYACSGWGERSDWYRNLQADSLVTIRVWHRTYAARAYRVEDPAEIQAVIKEMFTTGGDSHFEAWLRSYGIDFSAQDMQEKSDRLVFVGFEPTDQAGPRPFPRDLVWVWGVLLLLAWGLWRLLA